MSRIVMPHAFSLADPDLPRPSISFHPSPMPQLGENITIQCSVNNSYKAWYLYKDDGKKELQSVEASSSDAVFLIKNVSEADGGSYYCNYRPQSGSFISEASNIVDLYLVGEDLHDINLLASPASLITPTLPAVVLEDHLESDHTLVNIIRFVIGGLVTVLLGYILTLDRRFQREHVH
uniref:osteoclast-associated immunoglobulin-like receptor n=1 Tax=Podarcis muralis TaxID=64176 RepID=UPI0010A02934|nr:osteoclast-associated immunoglobulin-like receptor [Podarcis muralis]